MPGTNGAVPSRQSSMTAKVLTTYASQIYASLLAIVAIPVYLRFLGAEAYGLVGIFGLLQVVFRVMDLGLSATLSRETARFLAVGGPALEFRRLVRALEVLFAVIAVTGVVALTLSAPWIATHWLRLEALPPSTIAASLALMAGCAAARWMSELYRGIVTGSHNLVWLGRFSIVQETLRAGLGIAVVAFVTTDIIAFFSLQFAVALIECAVLAVKGYRLLPRVTPGQDIGLSLGPLRPILRFSLTLAFTSSVWILLTQVDKVVLSRVLSLSEYGRFALGVTVANFVSLAATPIAMPLLPRLTGLETANQQGELRALYRSSSQWVAVVTTGSAAFLAAFGEPLLVLWTGDPVAADEAAPVLALYALGNAAFGVSAFAYYLQFAKGDLSLHWRGNIVFLCTLVPISTFAALNYGPVGAGWAWFGANLAFLLLWVPLVHRRLARGLHLGWIARDVLPIALTAAAVAALLRGFAPTNGPALMSWAIVLAGGAAILFAAGCASSTVRAWVHDRFAPRA